MSIMRTALNWLTGPVTRAHALASETGIIPPSRLSYVGTVSTEAALSLSTVYRGIQIHATAVSQLSIGVERNGAQLAEQPSLVVKPDLETSRSAFLEYTIVSLYVDGNAFWKITRAPAGASRPDEVVNLAPLNPAEVSVNVRRDSFGIDHVTYWYRGTEYSRRDIQHLQLLRVPGKYRGLGPIQAATVEIRGALDARDYGSMWLTESSTPDGILTTDQVLAPNQAEQYKNVWYGRNADGSARTTTTDQPANPNERLRVLGQGLHYSPLMLKPSDVQFLETQQFNTTQIARLLGTPASLLLAAVEGNSQTYSNVEQDWIGYVRFSLMKPIREIEEAFSELLPGRQTARFNLAVLLRTDTKTRYEGHAIALDPVKGWMTADEVRAIEGMQPLTEKQRSELAARSTSTKQEQPA